MREVLLVFLLLNVILHTFDVITDNFHQGTSWYLSQDTGGETKQTFCSVRPSRKNVFRSFNCLRCYCPFPAHTVNMLFDTLLWDCVTVETQTEELNQSAIK